MASSLYLCLLVRTIIGEFRAHLDNLGCSRLEILNLITSFKTFPQIRSHFRDSGKGISFGDHYSTPCNVLTDLEEWFSSWCKHTHTDVNSGLSFKTQSYVEPQFVKR